MDLSAFITVIVLTALFFGFIVWLANHSRKNDSQGLPPASDSETESGDARGL